MKSFLYITFSHLLFSYYGLVLYTKPDRVNSQRFAEIVLDVKVDVLLGACMLVCLHDSILVSLLACKLALLHPFTFISLRVCFSLHIFHNWLLLLSPG